MAKGSYYYAALLTILPWEPLETWRIILRAESNILKTQSAQFVPELIEYSILLSLHPFILNIGGIFDLNDQSKWLNLIFPMIQLMEIGYAGQELENYVSFRPLSYITGPRFDGHGNGSALYRYSGSALHTHTFG